MGHFWLLCWIAGGSGCCQNIDPWDEGFSSAAPTAQSRWNMVCLEYRKRRGVLKVNILYPLSEIWCNTCIIHSVQTYLWEKGLFTSSIWLVLEPSLRIGFVLGDGQHGMKPSFQSSIGWAFYPTSPSHDSRYGKKVSNFSGPHEINEHHISKHLHSWSCHGNLSKNTTVNVIHSFGTLLWGYLMGSLLHRPGWIGSIVSPVLHGHFKLDQQKWSLRAIVFTCIALKKTKKCHEQISVSSKIGNSMCLRLFQLTLSSWPLCFPFWHFDGFNWFTLIMLASQHDA